MEILRKEERTLTKEEAAEFYKQHEGSEHFEDLVEFMSRLLFVCFLIHHSTLNDSSKQERKNQCFYIERLTQRNREYKI